MVKRSIGNPTPVYFGGGYSFNFQMVFIALASLANETTTQLLRVDYLLMIYPYNPAIIIVSAIILKYPDKYIYMFICVHTYIHTYIHIIRRTLIAKSDYICTCIHAYTYIPFTFIQTRNAYGIKEEWNTVVRSVRLQMVKLAAIGTNLS